MTAQRYYPPEWCGAETMAYMLDMGASTFRAYVSRGDLPPGRSINGIVRWHRERTLDAFERRASGRDQPQPVAEQSDPIMSRIISNAPKAKARRRTAPTHS